MDKISIVSYLTPIIYIAVMILCFCIILNPFYAYLVMYIIFTILYLNVLGCKYIKENILILSDRKSNISILSVVLIFLLLNLFLVHPTPHGIFGMSILQTCIVGWILAPIYEEFIFRGVLQTKLNDTFKNNKHGSYLSIIITSICFSLAHISYYGNPSSTGVIFLISLFLGYLRNKYKSLLPSVLVHMLNNIRSL